jgi:hypothetical protein
MLEMKLVLRAVLAHDTLDVASDELELSRRRAITLSPGRSATVVLRSRESPKRAATAGRDLVEAGA